jgi:hypothetical protein
MKQYYLKTYLGWITDSVIQEVSRDKSKAQKMTLNLAEKLARGLERNGVKGEIVEEK